MHFKLLIICVFFLSGFGMSKLLAQESINATGGIALGNGGSVTYSIGQPGFQTYSGINGSVAEGVQQPYEISVVTASDDIDGISFSVSIYPNPVSNYLILDFYENAVSNLSYQLLDMNGKILEDNIITDKQTSIAVDKLVPACYFLKITRLQGIVAHQEIKTFKIIKY